MRKQTQGSLILVGTVAGGVGFVAFVALMVVGEIAFSPALFFAILAATGAGTFLFFSFHTKSTPVGLVHPDQPRPSADQRHGDKTIKAGTAGVAAGSAGVTPGSAGVPTGSNAPAGQIPGSLPSHGDMRPDATGNTAGAAPTVETGGMPNPDAAGVDGKEADTGLSGRPQRPADEPRGAAVADPHGAGSTDTFGTGASEMPAESDALASGGTIGAMDRTTPITGDTSDTPSDGAASRQKAPGPADPIGTEPPRLDTPREGGADDLKRLNGIGPKIEASLNDLGIYHFDQIARWSVREITWVDERMDGLSGRIAHDDWVGQAKALSNTDGA